MPTISFFYGIVIQMFWREHSPPHIHASYQGFEALVAIETGEIIGGQLPAGARRIIRPWVLRHQAELMENWERGVQRLPLDRKSTRLNSSHIPLSRMPSSA